MVEDIVEHNGSRSPYCSVPLTMIAKKWTQASMNLKAEEFLHSLCTCTLVFVCPLFTFSETAQ